jgi:hypothetical protein
MKYREIQGSGKDFRTYFRQNHEPNEYIFCTKETYQEYILPHFAVHAMGLYQTMTYYQLSAGIADQLDRDYNRLLTCTDPQILDQITDRYGIQTVVMYIFENDYPVYRTLIDHWTPVYQDRYFTVFKKV